MLALQQLRALLAIKEHGSLTRAAAALHYGVPTITHHLNTLESQLRVQLVERTKRGTRLTELGTVLAADAAEILNRVAQAERWVTDYRVAGLVTLIVGTFPSIGSRLLPSAIRTLQDEMNVRVEVVEGEPIKLVELLHSGEIHCALIYDLAEDSPFEALELEFTTLNHEPYRLMVAADSPLAVRQTIDLDELRDKAWIFSRNEHEASQRVLQRVCGALAYEPREFMRTDDLNLIHGFVAADLALALTPASAVMPNFSVVVRDAKQDLGIRRLSFVVRRKTSPAARRLGEILAADAAAFDTKGAGTTG
jgi:DNA-binding transcriptional LysR family regulator